MNEQYFGFTKWDGAIDLSKYPEPNVGNGQLLTRILRDEGLSEKDCLRKGLAIMNLFLQRDAEEKRKAYVNTAN